MEGPQDSLVPQDATVFNLFIDRNFTFELRRRTGEILKTISKGTASEKRRSRDKFIWTAARAAVRGAAWILVEDAKPLGKHGKVPGASLDDRPRDLGNLFMARLITGYGENTVSVSDTGLRATRKGVEKAFGWSDVQWWSVDDLSMMIATTTQKSIAIPVDQLPRPAEERILENLRPLGPERAVQVRQPPSPKSTNPLERFRNS